MANHTNHPKMLRGTTPDGISEDTYFYCMASILKCNIQDAPIKEMPPYSETSKWPYLRGV